MYESFAPEVFIDESKTTTSSIFQTSPKSPAKDFQNTQLTPAITDTPFKHGSSTKFPWTTNACYRNLTVNTMGAEMKDYCVGPMPVQEFLEAFLPTSKIPDLPALTFKSGAFDSTICVKNEVLAYEPFIGTMKSFAPALSFVNTSNHADTRVAKAFSFGIKPDISIYADGTSHGCDVSTAEVLVELKWATIHDAFREPLDSKSSCVNPTMKGMDTLGQITSYAAAQLGAQYRTHAFSVLIIRDFARIIRWDTEGAIVTCAFEYNKYPHLADFFHRFSHASPALRGVDTSVTPASAEEAIRARLKLSLHLDTRMFKVTIPAAEGVGSYTLIIPAPVARGLSPVGHRTRTCAAFDLVNDKIVMFKDSWRVSLPDILPEGQTYKLLKDANVRNVAKCIACHDVPSLPQQLTQTFKFNKAPWTCSHNHLTPHVHYRLVLNLVGKPLILFMSSREVVEAVRDSLIAHEDACIKAGVLHRDLSAGNVVMHEGIGILIDWDLAKLLRIKGPRQITRTFPVTKGTWQFMSTNLVENKHAAHTIEDDLESSFYVVFWVVLMYTKSNLDTPTRSLLMKQVFEAEEMQGTGSNSKSAFLISRRQVDGDVFVGRKALDKLVLVLAELFAHRYILVTTEHQAAFDKTFPCLEPAKGTPTHAILLVNLKANTAYKKQVAMETLKSHSKVIAIYDEYLKSDAWLSHEVPTLQPLVDDEKRKPQEFFTKSQYPSQEETEVKLGLKLKPVIGQLRHDKFTGNLGDVFERFDEIPICILGSLAMCFPAKRVFPSI
ncbi:hypothetical protein DEU56DRAFT_761947 [Suillus clintonianus]|uniref:uncharacterized protein n=1 Tax=Suillus clintonianus TaxID=1904413 RepID=UPI001B86F208|nr:uncharacterized protein DEU56DRAFT_761947 [Suillus clintonianus]KAG2113385.1 hypothetical protein DEU56DRAFT_761947 [Suillus clintonianus]